MPIIVAQHIADGFVPGLVSWLDAGCQASRSRGRGRCGPGARNGLHLADRHQHHVGRQGHRARRARTRANSTSRARTPSSSPWRDRLRQAGRRRHSHWHGCRRRQRPQAAALARGAVTIAQDEETCIVFGMPKSSHRDGGGRSGAADPERSVRRSSSSSGSRISRDASSLGARRSRALYSAS